MIYRILPWFACALFLCSSTSGENAHYTLWDKVERTDEGRAGTVSAYLPQPGKGTGAAMVVVPGGSFIIRCEDQEGAQVGTWLSSHGIAAFVVHYRLIPTHTMREELGDVQRAIQFVRSRAKEFTIDGKRIGVIGFSAGSYLALASSLNEPALRDDNPISRESSRPDFLVMVYGAPSNNFTARDGMTRFFREQVGDDDWRKMWTYDEQALRSTPPTFMFATTEDAGAAGSMAEMYARLVRARVSIESHFFARGPHGVGLAFGDPTLGVWPVLMEKWLRTEGFLSPQKLVAVRGTVTVDGKPVELGQVIFRPVDDPRLPERTAYLFNRSAVPGEFVLEEKDGLAAGKYQVEFQQTALFWKSTWNDALILSLRRQMATNSLSAGNLAAWKEWSRERERGPSLSGPRVFKSKQPGGEPLVVEVEGGKELKLEFFTR